jgi:hypothetical protein
MGQISNKILRARAGRMVKYFTHNLITITMLSNLSNVSLSKKTIAIIITSFLIGASGGYIFRNYSIQSKIRDYQSEISDLSQSNKVLQLNISNLENELDGAQNTITTKEHELANAENDLNILGTNIVSLELEISKLTQDYLLLQDEYQTLLNKFNDTSSRYRLEYTIEKSDLVQYYNLPKTYYTSPEFEIKGSATKFEYNLWVQLSGTGSPNTQIRIHKAGQYQRIYTHYLEFKIDPGTSVNYVTGSFSHILEEGTYYLELYFDNRFTLAPAPTYQSSILIWDYY